MKKTLQKYSVIIFLLIIFFSGCDDMHDFEKQRDYPNDSIINDSTLDKKVIIDRMYVLSEGLFNQNNSTLALYSFSEKDDALKLQTNFFQKINKRGLGDTANDMQRYGSKLYIVVNVSSQIEILDLYSGKSIERIPMFNEKGIARQPRYIDFYKDKAYVCSFDGTVARIDTATLKIDKITKVGRNPDGICITNNKIYITNSGGLSFPNYDHTVSVIDINTFEEIKKIDVGMNPYKIHADSQGDVYVVTRGNYDDVGYSFHKIDSKKDEVLHTFENLPTYNFEIFEDKAYMYNYDFTTGENWIKVMDCLTEKIIDEKFIKDKDIIVNTPYALSINPYNGDVYVIDAQYYVNWGDIICFDKNGNFKYRINEIGLNPNHIVFLPKK